MPGDHTYSLTHEGITHAFTLHVPPGYDGRKPTPLVLDIHGSLSDRGQQLFVSGSPAVADKYQFIVAAPDGYMNSWNGDIAFGAAYERMLDDVGFMKALVSNISELANIDHARVYATGLSNGAAMSNTLGCKAADVFAGIAPVADPLDIGLSTCMPKQPIAVLGFHGYDDNYVPYDGGAGDGPGLPTPFPSIPDTLKAWGKVMSCVGDLEPVPLTGKSKCEFYRKCGRGAQVGYCSLQGGHLLYLQDGLNIVEYAWKFLSQFSLPLPDADHDGVSDQDDNCVDRANPDQADANQNCIGDACECTAAQGCDDGSFCNGSEKCANGRCESGTPPCDPASCNESARRCSPNQPTGSVATGGGGTVAPGALPAQPASAGASGADASGALNEASTPAPDAPAGSVATSGQTTTVAMPEASSHGGSGGCATLGAADASDAAGSCLLGIGWYLNRRRRKNLSSRGRCPSSRQPSTVSH